MSGHVCSLPTAVAYGEHLNKNPLHLQDPQYQSYLESNAEAAKRLASLVRDFVEYRKTRSTLEAMERKLEVQ